MTSRSGLRRRPASVAADDRAQQRHLNATSAVLASAVLDSDVRHLLRVVAQMLLTAREYRHDAELDAHHPAVRAVAARTGLGCDAVLTGAAHVADVLGGECPSDERQHALLAPLPARRPFSLP